MYEIVTLEEQGSREALGEGIGGTVSEVESSFRVNALAESAEGFRGLARLFLIKGGNLDAVYA
ncbi:hypothetical protein JOH52_000491 [Sinorhizobium meliloti]|nr:hypothetical protein SMRU11_21060 [Sinorhizobium meliloti RU11/001]ASP68245.1 hypothetical protein CDO29_27725 [Sinorhizobium meliloti]MBP2464470.1 hypothetical protein [Sinorhizobium meliloti]PST29106.1 hypothetical protein C7U62_05365 [Mesorhizobium loti]GEC38149.1 hypothetical protein EME01_22210 [Sinorhizobium meliloti]